MLASIVLFFAGLSVAGIGIAYLCQFELMVQSTGKRNRVETPTLKNALRSSYGGALPAFAVVYFMGAFVPSMEFAALVCLLALMAGYALGRMVSWVLDGRPSNFLIFITGVEVVYSILAIYLLL